MGSRVKEAAGSAAAARADFAHSGVAERGLSQDTANAGAPVGTLDESVSDEALMRLCQNGSQEALEVLYQRHYKPVFLFILRMIQNRDMAEDLIQETFMRVYNNRESWQPRSKFTSWLYRIARNICIDEKRRYWNRLVHMDSQLGPRNGNGQSNTLGDTSILDRVEDTSADAHTLFINKLDEELIKKAINQLSAEQREVIILNKYQGMSYIEISEILGATPESIKQRTYRAHLKLRQILKPLLEDYA